jgi:UDP-N-acetyl-2-amino-2-deoxyglucuronate dehydrogenase
MNNFALTGAAGYIAPRHLKAIQDTGNRLVAAVDPHVRFFTEVERFDRHLEKLRRGGEQDRVHYVSICSPNYLHDAHIRLALRVGADVICEKPLVINPWNLDALQELEAESGRRINTVLQLRLHPHLMALRARIDQGARSDHRVTLTYVTARGPWYDTSWKGSEERSGGIVTNIGIHLLDLLLWWFGPARACQVHLRTPRRTAGFLELERAQVRWFLSTDRNDLPFSAEPGARTTYRSITVDDAEVEFSEGFADLHTRIYEEALAGRGFGIDDSRPALELSRRIRDTAAELVPAHVHPMLAGAVR